MTATIALPRPDWLSRLRSIMVLRPGQRVVNVPGIGVSASRRAVSAGGGVVQDYLLDFDTLYVENTGGVYQQARDFQIASAASCLGARIKIISAFAEGAANVRLWRTDTETEVGAALGVRLTRYVNVVTFSSPIALIVGVTYRVSVYIATGYTCYYSANHAPDGAVTVLTSKSFWYANSDIYPTTDISSSFSVAIEPTITT